jgi:hypothetical protein
VGRVMGGNWRPHFDQRIALRELEIIKNDLHCNAVRICGLDVGRLMATAETALRLGLEVWLSPEMWDAGQEKTLKYITAAAATAEKLRERWPDRLVFLVGSELTLFMQGIVEGRTIVKRMSNPSFWNNARAGKHNEPLNAFLKNANEKVREVFHGQVSYASLVWENVDWSMFDFIGVDHYRIAQIRDRYIDLLKPFFSSGKPVVVTEFGYRTYRGAESGKGGGGDIVDHMSLYLGRIPLLGRFVRPKLKGAFIRDEHLQATELADQLRELDAAGIDGGFIMTFVSPIFPYDSDPKYDLDMGNYSLVKTYADGNRGTTYPDMAWEPKEAFWKVAEFYAL